MWLHTQASVNIARQILKHPQLCPSFPHLILRLSLGLCLCFAFGFCFLWLLGKFIISIITIPITLTIKVVMVIILIIPIRKHHTSVNSITRLGSSRFAFSTSGFCDFGVCLAKKATPLQPWVHPFKESFVKTRKMQSNPKHPAIDYKWKVCKSSIHSCIYVPTDIHLIYIQICTHVYIYIYCGALSFMKHHRTTNPSMSSFLSSHQWWHYLRLEPLCLQTVTCHFRLKPSQTRPDVGGASQVATRWLTY